MKNINKFSILESGKGWLAVDKPAGISIHNDPGKDLCSILSTELSKNVTLYKQLNYNPKFGINAVHRIDKETSGVVLLACIPEIFTYFSTQFEKRLIQKHYLALLHGIIENDNGIWDMPLANDAGGRENPIGKGQVVECKTRFRVMRRTIHYTLIDCEPLTGRKHQIRRHAKLAGHSVVGDTRYGTARSIKYLKEKLNFERLGLHAWSLSFLLPEKSEMKTIQSQLNFEMEELMKNDYYN